MTFSASFTSGTAYTLSIYAKQAGRNLRIYFPTGAFGFAFSAVFDLSAGTATIALTGTVASITNVGNGWYRCSITQTATASATSNFTLRLIEGASTTSYTGDGTSGIFIWGAMLNIGSTAGLYVQTVASAYYAPRFDYNPTTLAARGLLIEEQRTNSIRNNTGQGAVAGTPGTLPTNWTGGTTVDNLTREIVGTGTENGINYIDVRYSGTSGAAGNLTVLTFDALNFITAANAQTWTGAAYFKLVAGTLTNVILLSLTVRYNDSSGLSLTSQNSAFTPTASLERVTNTFTAANASTAFVAATLVANFTNDLPVDFTLRIGLPQLELGAFATSVIPTTTTALTRNADVASMTGTNFSDWYNAAEGTLYAEASALATGYNGSTVSFSDGTFNNRIVIRGMNTSSQCVSIGVVSGTTQWSILKASQTTALTKWALGYKVDDISFVRNADSPSTDTSALLPVVNQAKIGADGDGSVVYNGYIRRIAYYPTRLANTTLQALTA
jgi:hypothetical protein